MSNNLPGKFVALRYADGVTVIYLLGVDPLANASRPDIPGLTFDTFLHYEPDAGIADYVYRGTAKVMTEEQKVACLAFVNSVDYPGYAYDPARYNIYVGVMDKATAESKGYRITFTPIENDVTKFNEETGKWEQIIAIICPSGKVSFNILSVVQDTVSDDTDDSASNSESYCSGRLKDAVMVFTTEEWAEASKGQKNLTDIYDFKTKTWIDIRSFDDTVSELYSYLEHIFENIHRNNISNHLQGVPEVLCKFYIEYPEYIDQLPTDAEKELVREAIDTYKNLPDIRFDLSSKITTLCVRIKTATTLDQLDMARSDLILIEEEYRNKYNSDIDDDETSDSTME